jgi:hypothetical protein
VTLLRADLSRTQARQIGSPLPNAGEGFGGEGDSTQMNQFPETIAGRGSQGRCGHFNCAFAPSPLAPLPRWGEGDRILLPFQRKQNLVTIFCSLQ